MKKKMFSLLIATLLVVCLVPTTFAADSEATNAANSLHNLGLFNGTGTNADGTPIYDLDRAPSRFEAVTMLVRLLGKEGDAKEGNWNIPFTDIEEWAKPYVGYAYANGLTAGTSATTFGGSETITASQYLTFVLRSLGYESGKDFQWDKAWELSDKIGMTDGRYNVGSKDFLRGDVAIISNNALYMKLANSDKTLLDSFNARGFGMLEQNDKTMNAGGDSIIVEIDGKYHDNAPLTMWAYEFNGKISYYTDASNFQLLKILTKDYKLQPSQSANPKIEEALEYDMSQTSRVGISKWNAYPAPGVSQTWATYSYHGNMFSIALDNGGHDDNVMYYVDGVRCFDRVWDGKQYTFVNVDDFISRFGLKTEITFKNVEGINEAVWTFTDVVEVTPTPIPVPAIPEDEPTISGTEEENIGNVETPEEEVIYYYSVSPNTAVYNDKIYLMDNSYRAAYSSKDGEVYGYDSSFFKVLFNPVKIEKNDNPFTAGTLSYTNWVPEADGISYREENNFDYETKTEYISISETFETFTLTANGKTFDSMSSDEFIAGNFKENDSGIFNGIRYCICYNKPYYNMNDLAEYFGIENKSFHIEEAEDYSYRWIIKDESETK